MTEPATEPAANDLRVLQRVVFPTQGNLDVVALYVDTKLEAAPVRDELDDDDAKETDTQTTITSAPPAEVQTAVQFGRFGQASTTGDLAARRSAVVAAKRRVSFGTYFNAFPASYWRRWTNIGSVVLRMTLEGEATVVVYRSTARGHSHELMQRSLALHARLLREWPRLRELYRAEAEQFTSPENWRETFEKSTPGG